jgi:CubicO group peptidase (beta-lactamase class C family)
LIERGRLDLEAPAATYWPAFAVAGKEVITIRVLLTHYSGLSPDLSLRRPWSGYRTAMNLLIAERPLYPARTHYVYSDQNFEVLGEIVRRVSGIPTRTDVVMLNRCAQRA